MGIIQSCGKFYAPKISEKRICQTNEKVAFGREREREKESEGYRPANIFYFNAYTIC
jgi:hypothetical protein